MWSNLKSVLEWVELNNDKNKVVWCLENSKKNSVKSLYRHWFFGSVTLLINQKLWKNMILLKVKIFLWLALQNRLQTANQLKKRK